MTENESSKEAKAAITDEDLKAAFDALIQAGSDDTETAITKLSVQHGVTRERILQVAGKKPIPPEEMPPEEPETP